MYYGVLPCFTMYYYLLYRHECFTGKYTTRKIHKNYIRDPSGLFSIISHVAKTIFYSLAALVREMLFCHSKIKFISSRHRVISSMYYHVLPCITVYHYVQPCIAMYCHVLPCIAMYCHLSQCITMCYHILPCITMYCHVLPCIATHYYV